MNFWRRRTSFVGRLGLVAALAFPLTAEAETPPDVVLLNNGGMVRGTISETVPGEYVVIVTITGKERRIDSAEVDYAGPADKAPSSTPESPLDLAEEDDLPLEAPVEDAPPEVTRAERSSRTIGAHATSDREGVALYVRRETSTGVFVGPGMGGGVYAARVQLEGYEKLCTLPCEFNIEPGRHAFAVKYRSRRTVRIKREMQVSEGTQLDVDYKSRLGVRVGGLLAGVGGLAGGMLLMMDSLNTDCDYDDSNCSDIDTGKLTASVVISTAALGAIYLVWVPDGAKMSTRRSELAQKRKATQTAKARRPFATRRFLGGF